MPRSRFISTLFVVSLSTALFAQSAAPQPAQPTPPAGGDADAEVALQRKLDQPITLTLQKIELAEAFKRIAAEAKIPLQVDPTCYDLLPYGATIGISADFRQSRLRDSLEEILLPLGLQQTVTGKTVLIRPSAPLFHIGHRAEWEELKLLQDLHTASDLRPTANSSAPTAPGTPPPAASAFDLTTALRAALDARKDLIVSFANGEPGAPGTEANEAAAAALEQIRKQLPMSPYRALELYTQLTNQIWFVEAGPLAGGPTGGTIRIMSRRQWIERQLDRPIQLDARNETLEKVVADLSHASGIRIVPEPGLYQVAPRINLSSNNDTLRKTLELLSGVGGVAFDVRDDSLLLRLAPGPGTPGNTPPSKSDEIVGRISLPIGPEGGGLTMDLLLRESDLPRDLNERRKKAIRDTVESLQKSWPAPTPAVPPIPATAPATRPAPAPATTPATAPATTTQPDHH